MPSPQYGKTLSDDAGLLLCMPCIRLPGGSTLSEQGAAQLKIIFSWNGKADTVVSVGQVQLQNAKMSLSLDYSKKGKFRTIAGTHRLVDRLQTLEQGSAANVRLQCTQH